MTEIATSLTLRQAEAEAFDGRYELFRQNVAEATAFIEEADSNEQVAEDVYRGALRRLTDAFWEAPNFSHTSVMWLAHGHCMAKLVEISEHDRTGRYPEIARGTFKKAFKLMEADESLTVENEAKFAVVLADGMNIVGSEKYEVAEAERLVNDLRRRIDPMATGSWVIDQLATRKDWTAEANKLTAGSAILELMSDFSRDYPPLEESDRPARVKLFDRVRQLDFVTKAIPVLR